jgi:hypothetical protein
MEKVVERAIPKAIELGLGAVRSETQPYELRDALLLLEDAFFAGSDESEFLRNATPRVLDALADLDLNRIRKSGIELATLDGLLSQAESRLLKTGARDLEEVPLGGRTSPAALRRRWVMEDQLFGRDALHLEHKRNEPPEFR